MLGEQIYLKIVPNYPEKAAKVTGMFLEMDTGSLKETLENSDVFEIKLNEALRVLHTSSFEEEDNSNNILPDLDKKEEVNLMSENSSLKASSNKGEMESERQDLGEQLYLKIVAKHPLEAPRITGMFLEMNLQYLKELSENSELFNKKLNESVKVLSELKQSKNS